MSTATSTASLVAKISSEAWVGLVPETVTNIWSIPSSVTKGGEGIHCSLGSTAQSVKTVNK